MQKTDYKNSSQYYLNSELNKTLGLVRHLCENSNKIVLLNGPEGIGKTSLVHQFSEQNKQYLHCEIVHARAGYSAEQLATEIAVAYGSVQPIHTDNPASLITTFDHLFEDGDRVERQPVIIIDGLNNLSESTRIWLSRLYQASLNSSLLSIIVTVDAEDGGALDLSLILPGLNDLNIHSIEVPCFTLEDAQVYLLSDKYAETASLQLSAKEIKKFYKKTHGIPSLLLQYAQAMMKEKSGSSGTFKRQKEKLMSDEKNYDEEDEIIMGKLSAKPDNELEELEQELNKRKRSKKKKAGSFFEKNKITIIAVAGVLIAILILQSYINKLFEPEAEQNSTELALPDEQESILDLLDDAEDYPGEDDSEDFLGDEGVAEDEPVDPLAELRMAEPEPEVATQQEQMESDFSQLSQGFNEQITEAETAVPKMEKVATANAVVAPVEQPAPPPAAEPESQPMTPAIVPEVVEKPVPQKPVAKEQAAPVTTVNGQRSNDWVLSQSGQRFTMQLSGASSPDSYKSFINKHRLDSELVAIVKTQRKGKDWYSLLYGNYPTKAAAQVAVKQFPKIRGIWVRPFKDIQKQL